MKCPRCGTEMKELPVWSFAPTGGYVCKDCGLKISKKP